MIPNMTILAAFGFLAQKRCICWPSSKMVKGGQKIFKIGHENPKDYLDNPKVVKNQALRARAKMKSENTTNNPMSGPFKRVRVDTITGTRLVRPIKICSALTQHKGKRMHE